MFQLTEHSFVLVTTPSNLHRLQSFLQGLEPGHGVACLSVSESLPPAQDTTGFNGNSQMSIAALPELLMIPFWIPQSCLCLSLCQMFALVINIR